MSNQIIDTTLLLWRSGRKIKRAASGWLSGNAVCCSHNNQSPDKRGRGGIIIDNSKLNYSCFNCGFKTGYSEGGILSSRMKLLLGWLGASQQEIDRLTIEAVRMRDDSLGVKSQLRRDSLPKFQTFEHRPLPEGSTPIDPEKHGWAVDYLNSRGLSHKDYTYFVTPEALGRDAHKIIIPYYYNGQLVGNTARFCDDRKPKYISDQQRGYVFNIDAQHKDWQVCFLVEGQFDALSIGGCAYMSSTILDEQANLIERLYRKIIVVPDRDKTGMEICDRALELGYYVALPEWDSSVKDTNDAVKRYGRLATTLSIIQSATTNKIKIEKERKKYK